MLVIGITGNTGSGKSTVCRILGRLGAVIVDADKLAHESYKPHSQAWRELINAFGKEILKIDDEIDRQKLGEMVFSDPAALAKLNQIVHPKTYLMTQEKIEYHRRQEVEVIALEATLLIEAGWQNLADQIWLVIAPEAAVLQRLKEYQGADEWQILARLKSQMPVEEKMKYADEIISNDGDLAQLESKMVELWHKLLTK